MSINDSLKQLQEIDFNNIDFEKIGVWPAPAKVFIVAFLVGLVFALTYYLQISDLNDSLAASKSTEVELRKKYETKSFEAANIEAYRAQMEEMKGAFQSLLSRLPSKTQVPGLLEDIEARGTESGLTIGGTTIKEEKSAEYYIEVPFSINVDGGYHDLGGFVSGVASMPRIVTLHDYEITKKKDSNVLNMVISARTYRYKSQEQEK
jgi:type IV pilus assembly protein PilO